MSDNNLTQPIPVLKVSKKDPQAIIPSKKRKEDVGYDLTLIRKVKDMGDKTTLYDTGIIVEPPAGYYVEVVPRSSLSKTGHILSNSMGIIDPPYRDSIKVPVTRVDDSTETFSTEKFVDRYTGDLILPFTGFQLIVRQHVHVEIEEVKEDELTVTDRGTGGFGSTGALNQHKSD